MDPKKTGYKIISEDWTSFNRKKKYSCPGIFEEDVIPELACAGMHYFPNMIDLVIDRYIHEILFSLPAGSELQHNHIVVVIDRGDTDIRSKCITVDMIQLGIPQPAISCTNKLEIVRELSLKEIEAILECELNQRYGLLAEGGETMNAGLPRNR